MKGSVKKEEELARDMAKTIVSMLLNGTLVHFEKLNALVRKTNHFDSCRTPYKG